IAELGSFSVLNTIRERLLVVMHQDDTHQESFIWRGPVSFLKNLAKANGSEDPITIYNWQKKKDDDGQIIIEDFSDAVDLSETIESIISKGPKTVGFKKDQLGHTMLLIICSLKIIHLATLEEVVFILKTFGIDTEPKAVKQYLSLLKSLNLVALKPYRNYEFYLASPQSDWFSWGYDTKEAKNRDANRWANQFVEFYENNQKEKIRALRSYLKSTGQVGD
ncbi:MAG: retron St85 family effector protein, partial [Promethearchaeota archaeon]